MDKASPSPRCVNGLLEATSFVLPGLVDCPQLRGVRTDETRMEWFDLEPRSAGEPNGVLELPASAGTPGTALELHLLAPRDCRTIAFWLLENGDFLAVAVVGSA